MGRRRPAAYVSSLASAAVFRAWRHRVNKSTRAWAAGRRAAAAVAPAAGAGPVDWTQYEARFASQLAFMSEMGFQDKEANIAALLAAGGNVDAAVDRMIATGAAATGASPASGNAAP